MYDALVKREGKDRCCLSSFSSILYRPGGTAAVAGVVPIDNRPLCETNKEKQSVLIWSVACVWMAQPEYKEEDKGRPHAIAKR